MRQTFVGSLVARILFQPVEETLRLFFSRLLPSTHAPTPSARTRALRTLHTVLSIQTAAALLLLVFGPPYLPIALPASPPTGVPRDERAPCARRVDMVRSCPRGERRTRGVPRERRAPARTEFAEPVRVAFTRVPLQSTDGTQLDGCVLRRVRRPCAHAIPPRRRRRIPRLRQHRQTSSCASRTAQLSLRASSALHRHLRPSCDYALFSLLGLMC